MIRKGIQNEDKGGTRIKIKMHELKVAAKKAFDGDEYQDIIFKEAVKCLDSELALKIPEREHGVIVQKVLSLQQEKALNQQKYSIEHQPPTKQKSR